MFSGYQGIFKKRPAPEGAGKKSGLYHTPRTVIVLNVVGGGQAANYHALGAGGVDHFAVSDIDTHVGDPGAVCILQEYKVTGLEVAFCHIGADLILLGCGSG